MTAAQHGSNHRFFKILFAVPAFGVVLFAVSVVLGLNPSIALAASMSALASVLMIAAATAAGMSQTIGLAILTALFSATAYSLMPVAGPSVLLPLALLVGGETYYVTRNLPHSGIATLAALGLALVGVGPAGFIAASPLIAFAMTGFSLIHGVTLMLRNYALPQPKSSTPETSLADRIFNAENVVRIKMSMTGEVVGVEGDCANTLGVSAKVLHGFGLFDRVLVGDRVTYLSALDDMRIGNAKAQIVVKLRDASEDGAFFNARLLFCRLDDSSIAASVTRVTDEMTRPLSVVTATSSESQINADRYLASVSHELRTPLNAILGFSDILKQEMFGPLANERQREYVGLIHQSGAHLLSVVNMILDMSKLDMGAYHIIAEPFDIEEAVSMSIAMVREQAAAKGILLDVGFCKTVKECTGDRRAVQQILINLLSNAVKFTPQNGIVKVTTGEQDGYLVLDVADNGIGISGDDLEKIGQPFFQVQNDYTRGFEGTGLGLSLVRGLVDLHAGGLSVESELGRGTSVVVRLPLAGPSKVSGNRPEKLSERRQGSAAIASLIDGAIAKGARNDPAIRKTA